MRIESNYPTPVQGVSTLAPRNRARGQAGLQVNMRSDPVAKLTRRPPLEYGYELLNTSGAIAYHEYYRRGKNFEIIITTEGTTYCYIDGDLKKTSTALAGYAFNSTNNLLLETINDTTFVVNTGKKVYMSADTDEDIVTKAAHLNVTSALSYKETLTVKVSGSTIVPFSVSVTIGGASDADRDKSDEDRATNAVAESVAAKINADTSNSDVTAFAKGSSVSVSMDDNSKWVSLEVESGDGDDNVVAFNEVTEQIAGLPLYARLGTVITVKPNPASAEGTYYLQAVGLDGATVATGDYTVEVVWTEWRSPLEPYKINPAYMPHTIVYEGSDDFTVGEPDVGWEERTRGDNESVPLPKFVGRNILALGQFQKRLVVTSDNDLEMTVTDNLFNWWKQSAISLLVTDPISITSNSTGIDTLRHIVEHNRDLLIVASNGQFKIDGTQGITPQTVAMPLTTTQEVQITVPPVSVGTSIFLPINYGDSTGLVDYTGSRDQVDAVTPVTHHVIGYMQGVAQLLAGSPNLDMVAMTTTDSPANVLFIYEQFTHAGKKTQQSWSTWELPTSDEILHITFRRDELIVIVKVGDSVRLKTINMYSKVALAPEEVYLDDMLTRWSSDGEAVLVPEEYPDDEDIIVVAGDHTKYPLFKIDYTRDGRTIRFNKNILVDGDPVYPRVHIGRPYRSAYQPTRPFREDDKGVAITSDRIRINSYLISVVDTERVTMTTHSKYSETLDQTKTFRIMNSMDNRVGEVNLYTGDFKFSYAQNAAHADVEFWTEGWLGLTISSISWKGQYHKTSGRI